MPRITSLIALISRNGFRFRWQVRDRIGETLAQGHEPTQIKARAASTAAKVKLLEENPIYRKPICKGSRASYLAWSARRKVEGMKGAA